MEPDISGQITMLYYEDMGRARQFYGDFLNLKKTLENDWVTLFRVTPHSSIGIVKDGVAGGYHRAQPENAVMISLVTNDVVSWYERLKAVEGIQFIKHLYDAKSMPIKAFLITDPGGYTVEFFQWNDQNDRNGQAAEP